ncbi:hypothetical protein [uncultured Mediterranean phage]|nr:hypothetical protein [uncultured Mediterranean phage]
MIIIAAVTSSTAVVLWSVAQAKGRELAELKELTEAQALSLRAANRAAEEARRVMETAQMRSEVILKERDRVVGRLESERARLLKAGADPVEMAKVWNEVFGD